MRPSSIGYSICGCLLRAQTEFKTVIVKYSWSITTLITRYAILFYLSVFRHSPTAQELTNFFPLTLSANAQANRWRYLFGWPWQLYQRPVRIFTKWLPLVTLLTVSGQAQDSPRICTERYYYIQDPAAPRLLLSLPLVARPRPSTHIESVSTIDSQTTTCDQPG